MLYKPDDCRVHKRNTSVLYSQVKHVCFLQVHVFLRFPPVGVLDLSIFNLITGENCELFILSRPKCLNALSGSIFHHEN